MSLPPESRNEAITRLNQSASELEARTARKAAMDLGAAKVTGEAYKIIAELIGGVLVGLALGFGFDRLLGTNPWGLIGGVLLGFALSIYMARRTANRLMAQAKASGIEPQSIPFDDEEDEDR
ncbi:MAG TPA: AtpZ/AtpI family protein [Brevundimonas sp.]|uniref:AtpZ/AtpI family protein n=1 Tax=Brevundimonas sp. TaxID=1871086 RepID=UPI00260B8FFB|nr:AtpZ/AtpI family protein [Brevundimonas sp.]HRO31888.1 AtpZ/AtpI family protein [Brevundimonas sp.]